MCKPDSKLSFVLTKTLGQVPKQLQENKVSGNKLYTESSFDKLSF